MAIFVVKEPFRFKSKRYVPGDTLNLSDEDLSKFKSHPELIKPVSEKATDDSESNTEKSDKAANDKLTGNKSNFQKSNRR